MQRYARLSFSILTANLLLNTVNRFIICFTLTCLLGPKALWAETPPSSVAASTPIAEAIRLFDSGKYPEARAAFETISAAEPANANAVFYLGWTEYRLQQFASSVIHLEKAVSLDGTHSLWYHVLGFACGEAALRASFFSKMSYGRKILPAYNRGIELDPDNVELRRSRALFYKNAPGFVGGDSARASTEVEEIQKRNPLLSARLRYEFAMQDKKYDDARAQAEIVRQHQPSDGAALLVDALLAEKKSAEAFSLIDGLIAQYPDAPVFRFQLGRLAAITGKQLDRGEAALRDYLQYAPTANEPQAFQAHWRLGNLLEKKGDKAAARAEYETALQLNPNFRPAQEALKKLNPESDRSTR